jgi:hypothetical protein
MMPSNTMMPYAMMSGDWMSGTVAITNTMSMAQMGMMLDQMMIHMSMMMPTMPISGTLPSYTMPFSGTMPMAEMGQMMQVMGLMQQRLGQMHMMMGARMSGGMMDNGMMDNGSMMGPGMMGENSEPRATSVAPEANVPEAVSAPKLSLVPANATAGAVSISVTPRANSDPSTISFDVALNTHTVELDFDLAEHTTLTIGAARYAPTSWEPNTPGGHHVSGTLTFILEDAARAALVEADTVELTFDDIAGAQATIALPVDHE